MDKQASEPIESFLAYFRDCEQKYRMVVDDEEEMNRITQDILHETELEEHDYHGYAKLSKELKATRQKRREAKDTIKCLLSIVNWAELNASVLKNIERLLGDVRKAEKSLENRAYAQRSTIRAKGQ